MQDSKKSKAVELFAAGGMTQMQIAAQVGVHYKTVAKWRKDPSFSEAVLYRSRELLKESLPDIYITLSQHAQKGSHQHIKLILEHLERMEAMRNTAELGQVTFTWRPKDQ